MDTNIANDPSTLFDVPGSTCLVRPQLAPTAAPVVVFNNKRTYDKQQTINGIDEYKSLKMRIQAFL
jgi:hypothetical protein